MFNEMCDVRLLSSGRSLNPQLRRFVVEKKEIIVIKGATGGYLIFYHPANDDPASPSKPHYLQ